MTTTTITIPKELIPQVDDLIKEFGFDSKEEFFQEAIKDKVLELHKKVFFQETSKIAQHLHEKRVTEESN